MGKSPKKLDLDVEQSTNLLRICLNADQRRTDGKEEKDRASVLLDVLASKLPVDPALLESLPPILRALSEDLQSVSGLPLGDLLQDSKTRMAIIRRIKDFAKELGSSVKDKIERDVALAVYFAAIASALLFHGVKISGYSYEELGQSFDTLSRHDWVPPDLSRLFKKARKYCSNKD
ncbi:MAG: hypothetical protein JSW47_07595 [Phycisphaerales bacterium]|nr:MAG: hypothetical protein JSW47_07595 [Phycisphaerales bacterium]